MRQALERDEQRERAWIVSYQGIRVPSDWDANHSQSPSRGATARLADLLAQHAEQEPLLDLVIFDEAHYMRNENTGRMADWGVCCANVQRLPADALGNAD